MGKWNGLVHSVRHFASKHSSEILIGVGIAGWITTTVLAVKETPKAVKIIEEVKREKDTDELHPVEVVKATWKCYLWPFIFAVASTSCILVANSKYKKHYAALTTAYKLSEEALNAYKDSVIETVGEEKAKEISKKASKKQIDIHPTKSEVILAGSGQYLCYEPVGNTYFQSDTESIRAAINNINHQLLVNDYATLNDIYDEFGLKHTVIGDTMGWNIGKGMVEASFSSTMSDDGRPCLVIDWVKRPYADF